MSTVKIIIKTAAAMAVNVPEMATAVAATRSQIFVGSMGIMSGLIAPSIAVVTITGAAVVAEAATTPTKIEVAADLWMKAEGTIIMKIREMAPTIGAKIGAEKGIKAKSTALSVRIPR